MNVAVLDAGDRGRGVFAARPFVYGEAITADPVVEVGEDQVGYLLHTNLCNYYWDWGDEGEVAVAFGPSSMMNHSRDPNAVAIPLTTLRTLIVRAIRPIAAGDEITLDYGPEGARFG